ncbi:hypothetical protein [Pseudomonas denitrificans (nom. rej.)]|uniref:hypothetical protein n=1 Tax=Pseudomonas denitrificans TaxID=43306 RepID=UPI001E35F7A0|nr:hypothetical protein [Pseudomonas denitrificans (nom. rej.)]
MQQALRVDAGATEDAVDVAALVADEASQAAGGSGQHADVAGQGQAQAGRGKQRLAHVGYRSCYEVLGARRTREQGTRKQSKSRASPIATNNPDMAPRLACSCHSTGQTGDFRHQKRAPCARWGNG